MDVYVDVDVDAIVGAIGNVGLIDTQIVAALGHGNDTVVVIGIVAAVDVVDVILRRGRQRAIDLSQHGLELLEVARERPRSTANGVIDYGADHVHDVDRGHDANHDHGVVPVPERGHDQGCDQVHVPDHAHDHDQVYAVRQRAVRDSGVRAGRAC